MNNVREIITLTTAAKNRVKEIIAKGKKKLYWYKNRN